MLRAISTAQYLTRAAIHGGGTVFELMPNESGGWTEKKLHNFGTGADGCFPWPA